MKKLLFLFITSTLLIIGLEITLQVAALWTNFYVPQPTFTKNSKRIIVTLGESTTSSSWSKRSWPNLLEEKLNTLHPGQYKVINLAVTGKSSTYIYDHLISYLSETGVKPFLIISMLGINDSFLSSNFIHIPTFITPDSKKVEIKTFKLFFLIYKKLKQVDLSLQLTKSNRTNIKKYNDMNPKDRTNTEQQIEDNINFVNQNLYSLIDQSRTSKSVNLIDDKILNSYYDQHRYLYEKYTISGYPQKIIPLLEKAIQKNPNSLYFHYLLAGVLSDLGKKQLAMTYTKKAQKLSKNRIHIDQYNVLNKLAIMTYQRGIKLIIMQYPLLSINPLKVILKKHKHITYVSNLENFLSRVNHQNYYNYFTDRFAGIFGHCTPLGNELIAQNLIETYFENISK